jgi:predicted ATP-dependent endonuclease of OLD family
MKQQNYIFEEIFTDQNMESKLIVKNFGPIKEVELVLKNVNVFIGPQATGKSALAKVYTIFKAPRKFFYKKDSEKGIIVIDNEKASKEVPDVFSEYNINSFLTPETEISFESELHTIKYVNGALEYVPKLFNKLNYIEGLCTDFDTNQKIIATKFQELCNKFIFLGARATRVILGSSKPATVFIKDEDLEEINSVQCKELIEESRELEDQLSSNTAIYIPAERNLASIVKKAALNLIKNNAPIPKHILSFGAELEKLSIREIELDFIQKNLKYRIVNGEDKIYINDDKFISLEEAASGIQSVIPVLASILDKKDVNHRSFVIEEPELNLFPFAQYKLINFLELNRKDPIFEWEDYGTIHTYTTHSPYVLSSLNNLLYAHKVKSIMSEKRDKSKPIVEEITRIEETVSKIITASLSPNSFTAYQICDGYAKSIFNQDTGLIEENYIDESTDKINDDFEALMELTK